MDIFKEILEAHSKPADVYNIRPCFYCSHNIDLTADQYVRTPTLDSTLDGKPEAYAHELCAAEADQEHLDDKAYEDAMDYVDSLSVGGEDD